MWPARRDRPEPATDRRPDPQPPLPLPSLIGRDRDVDAMLGTLDASRLVTLVGTGGIGKTRLALAIAERDQDCTLGNVCLVELAALAGLRSRLPCAPSPVGQFGARRRHSYPDTTAAPAFRRRLRPTSMAAGAASASGRRR